MSIWEKIAEDRITAAMAAGEFDNLAGQGQPLDLTDDETIPPDLRLAYRILKNAGIVPVVVLIQQEIETLQAQLQATSDATLRTQLEQQIRWQQLRVAEMRHTKARAT